MSESGKTEIASPSFEIITKIRNAQEAINRGLAAYRSDDFKQAVDCLSRGLDIEKDYWLCRLYLAMSYFHIGKLDLCEKEFTHLLNWCPDREMRRKAVQALQYLNPESQLLKDQAVKDAKLMGSAQDFGWS